MTQYHLVFQAGVRCIIKNTVPKKPKRIITITIMMMIIIMIIIIIIIIIMFYSF